MKNLARFLSFAALLLPAGASADVLADSYQAAQLEVRALKAAPSPVPAASERLKIVREISLRSNRHAIRRLLVSSEHLSGSEVLRRDAARGDGGKSSRYIGYAFAAEPLADGAVGIKPASQENKAVGGVRGSHSGPGVAAFEFMAVGAHGALTQGTRYDAGVERSLVVEVAFDELDALFRGKRDFLEAEAAYYIRGGFDREVYDAETLMTWRERSRFYSPSLELNNYLAGFQAKNRGKRNAGDPEISSQEDRIRAIMKEAARLEDKPSARRVRVTADRAAQTRDRDALVFEFKD